MRCSRSASAPLWNHTSPRPSSLIGVSRRPLKWAAKPLKNAREGVQTKARCTIPESLKDSRAPVDVRVCSSTRADGGEHVAGLLDGFAGASDRCRGGGRICPVGSGALRDRRCDGGALDPAMAGYRRADGASSGKPEEVGAGRARGVPSRSARRQVDITLDEMRARLEDERGVRAARTTIWRFFARRGFTVKKRPGMRASRSAPTSRRRGSPGSPASRSSTRSA